MQDIHIIKHESAVMLFVSCENNWDDTDQVDIGNSSDNAMADKRKTTKGQIVQKRLFSYLVGNLKISNMNPSKSCG